MDEFTEDKDYEKAFEVIRIFHLVMVLLWLSLSTKVFAEGTEVSPGIVFYNGDSTRSSFLGSASVAYHFNRSFWIGMDFMGGKAHVDRNSGTGISANDRLIAVNGAFYWNMAALLDNSVGADFYTAIGVGPIWIGPRREIFGFVGGGLTVHPGWKNLSVRFDLKNLFFMLKNSQGADFNSDMALTLGPSLKF